MMENFEAAVQGAQCRICPKEVASFRCLDCGYWFCDRDALHHGALAPSHKMVGKDVVKRMGPSALKPRVKPCANHADQNIVFFCSCGEGICMMCSMLSHQDHRKTPIQEESKKRREKLQTCIDRNRAYQANLNNCLGAIADVEANSTQASAQRLASIEQLAKRVGQELEKRIGYLSHHSLLLAEANNAKLRRQKEVTEAGLAKAISESTDADRMVSENTDIEMIQIKTDEFEALCARVETEELKELSPIVQCNFASDGRLIGTDEEWHAVIEAINNLGKTAAQTWLESRMAMLQLDSNSSSSATADAPQPASSLQDS